MNENYNKNYKDNFEEKLKHQVGSKIFNKAIENLENHKSQNFVEVNNDKSNEKCFMRKNIADVLIKRKECSLPKKYFFMK